MGKGAVFSARFHVQTYEDECLVQDFKSPNRILRVGLRAIVTQGVTPASFDTFDIGSGTAPDSAALPGLVAPIPGARKQGVVVPVAFPEWSYTAVYEPGEATGEWTEIGMCLGDAMLNRAVFVDEAGNIVPISKSAGRRAVVTVVFTMSRR